MARRNPHFSQLRPLYLFPEIQQRKEQFLAQNPQAKLISLSIGDTTEPLPPTCVESLIAAAQALGNPVGYTGYGPEQGELPLREKIAEVIYKGRVRAPDIFISDGAKCDVGRLQLLFGSNVSVALQNPAYPVYLDGCLIQGVKNRTLLPCTPENDFFPPLSNLPPFDLLYFCSPNNPTGAAATRKQLESLVEYARVNRTIILFDAAYAPFIQDPAIPKSIYEIPGAENVAIEISSFSKIAGFTGVRLGWTVVPEELKFENGESVRADWKRLMSTLFNGASNLVQKGGLGALSAQGQQEVKALADFYMENTRLLKERLISLGYRVYGGDHAPYLWLSFPGRKSWDVFQEFLDRFHIVSTPGEGFGTCGQGFLRLSAFGHRNTLLEALERLKAFQPVNEVVKT